jgi:hypothetical protein
MERVGLEPMPSLELALKSYFLLRQSETAAAGA